MHHSVDAMIDYHKADGSLQQAVAFVNDSSRPLVAEQRTTVDKAIGTIRRLAGIVERDPDAYNAQGGGWIVSRCEGLWDLHFDALLFWSVDGRWGSDGD